MVGGVKNHVFAEMLKGVANNKTSWQCLILLGFLCTVLTVRVPAKVSMN